MSPEPAEGGRPGLARTGLLAAALTGSGAVVFALGGVVPGAALAYLAVVTVTLGCFGVDVPSYPARLLAWLFPPASEGASDRDRQAGRRPGRLLSPLLRSVPVAAVLALLGRDRLAAVALGAGVVLSALGAVAPVVVERLDAAVVHVAHGLSVLIASLAFLLLLPVSAVNRLVGIDPLGRRRGWHPVGSWRAGDDRPDRLASIERATPAPVGRRLLRAGAIGSVVVAAIVVPRLVERSHRPPTVRIGANANSYRPFAHEHEPFARALARDMDRGWTVPDTVLGWRNGVGTSRFVNVDGGSRRTTAPPGPGVVDGPVRTVWFFGGSTMFGVGQRDDHTIPSDVVRLAAADGVRLRAVNFGTMAYVHWQELQLFEQLLSTRPAPDLAVFYDGVNDVGLALKRLQRGDDRTTIQRDLATPAEEELAKSTSPGHHYAGRALTERWVSIASSQYRRGVEVERHLASAYGVPVLNFWQPQLATRTPLGPDAPVARNLGLEPATLARNARVIARVLRASGTAPIDLTATLDAGTEPVYLDYGHTNELGAQEVATAMWAHLRPALAEAPADG